MSDSPFIHNVGVENFQALVLENSFKQPVLVDFWADWCQPCQTIMPMLAKLAAEYNGKFHLAKVDTEAEQQLAAHFQIKSLPTMKLFVNGQQVDERMGALPEGEIRAFIDKYLTSESDELMTAARQASHEGRTQDAMDIMNQALSRDPDNADLKIDIAQLVMSQGDNAAALALLDSLDEEGRKKDAAIKLRAEIDMTEKLKDLAPIEEIEQKLAANPDDLEALMDKGNHFTAMGDYDQAMQCLLRLMMLDRQFKDDAGRQGLLALFDLLGGEHPSVQKYRRKMFTLLH
ncbi:MAG: thioredoxin [Gammaproteobacteria bacterium]|nr:thioredoxin [Gammaproteobacteria bacterium]